MRLSDGDIIRAMKEGRIQIQPSPPEKDITGVTVDLRLGNYFQVFKEHAAPFIDCSGDSREIGATMRNVMSDQIFVPDTESFYLHPDQLALGVTLEHVTIPDDLVGWLDGRSSLARLGLMVHVTAHRIDPGWDGRIVLEFVNAGKLPLALRPGMKIGALSFETTTAPCLRPYNKRTDAKYQQQTNAVASRLDKE